MLSVYRTRDFMNKRDKETRRDFYISTDLIVEILKKLPAKSLVRFRSVSKQWSIIICSRRDFIESIITRSLAQPPQKVPLFIFNHPMKKEFCTVYFVIAESTKPAELVLPGLCSYLYIRGLVCCSSPASRLVTIYNPTTRQSFPLPKIKFSKKTRYVVCNYYFGYDPIENQYKVLNITVKNWKPICHVFKLERGQSWRKIQSIDEKEELYPRSSKVCINGTIFFVAGKTRVGIKCSEYLLLSFNIRSEKFDHVWAPEALLKALLIIPQHRRDHGTLVNYLGKLGCICFTWDYASIWIMDNGEKQEWSRSIIWLPNYTLTLDMFSGVTPGGEIFETPIGYVSSDKSFYVNYYNIKQNSFRRVEIKGTSNWIRGHVIYDHVENTMWL